MENNGNAATPAAPQTSVPNAAQAQAATSATEAGTQPGSQPASVQGATGTPGTPSGTQAPSQTETTPPAFTFDEALTDDDKNYLKSQGVTEYNAEGLKKFIDAHRSLRAKKEAPDNAQQQTENILNALGPQGTPAQPATPEVPNPAQPIQPTQSQVTATPATPATGLPSQSVVYNTSRNLIAEYPLLKDSIGTGDFFKEMTSVGLSPVTNGDFNLEAIRQYAGMKHRTLELEQKLSQATQPSTANTPTPSSAPTVTGDQRVETMTMTAAENIVMQSQRNQRFGQAPLPQYEEALRFMETNNR